MHKHRWAVFAAAFLVAGAVVAAAFAVVGALCIWISMRLRQPQPG